MICVLLGASLLFVSLIVSLPQSSLLYTPFERAIHDLEFAKNTLCASLISFELDSFAHSASLISFELDSFAHSTSLISFECDNFCSSASLISFRAWWWICLEETIDIFP